MLSLSGGYKYLCRAVVLNSNWTTLTPAGLWDPKHYSNKTNEDQLCREAVMPDQPIPLPSGSGTSLTFSLLLFFFHNFSFRYMKCNQFQKQRRDLVSYFLHRFLGCFLFCFTSLTTHRNNSKWTQIVIVSLNMRTPPHHTDMLHLGLFSPTPPGRSTI